MGSSNVSCSISNLSINTGDKVAFIPLVAARYMPSDTTLVVPDAMLIYPYALLNPLCLPIIGEYNDYGGVEDIQEDVNTKAIEAFIGLPIADFMSCVTCGRAPHDYFGDIYGNLVDEDQKQARKDYKTPFAGKYLEITGFERLNITGEAWYDYKRKDFPYLVKLVPSYDNQNEGYGHRILGVGFEIYDSNGIVVASCGWYDPKMEICQAYLKLTKYHIYVSEENQWKVNLLSRCSGMFIHGDLWDHMSAVDAEELTRMNKSHGDLFDEMQQKLIEYDEGDPEFRIVKAKSIEEQEARHKLMVEMFGTERTGKFEPRKPGTEYKVPRLFPEDPMRRFGGGFIRYYDEWDFFKEIYRDGIKDGSLRQCFIDYHNFYWQMYSGNRFFFPGMNGEQCGNDDLQLSLAEVAVKLLKKRIKEREDW